MKALTKDRKHGLLVAATVLVVLLVPLIFLKDLSLILTDALLCVIAALASIICLKKRSIHSYNKREVTVIILVVAALYLTLFFLSGLKFGFYSSPKGNISLNSLFRYVLPVTVIILASEVIRDVLLAVNLRVVTILSYAVGVVTDIAAAGGVSDFRTVFHLSDFFGMTLFPALTANILYTYLTKRYGKAPSLAYRCVMTLYVYFVPIMPDLPRALPAFLILVLPLATLAFINLLFEKQIKSARRRRGKLDIVFTAILVVMLLCFVLLITCQFRFGMLVIATDSMTGSINRGDAVVYESIEHCDGIKENDVIVFEENNRLVVHRVVSINSVNGQTQYITKGDANEGIDAGFRTEGHIVGVVRFKVIYIGYPSLWLREIINDG